jgi:DNA polymerase-3 subunit beta
VFGLQELLRAARTAAIFARDGSGIVRLQVVPGGEGAPAGDSGARRGKVIISARAEEMGDNQDEVDTMVEGVESKIAFNARYLLDVLSVMDRPEVALETSSPSSPGVFKATDSDSYVHVVMPMFVQW